MIIKIILFFMGLFTLPFGVFFWILAVMIGNKQQQPKQKSDIEKGTDWLNQKSKQLEDWTKKQEAKRK